MCARIHRLNSRRIICFLALHTTAIIQAYQTDVLKEIRGDWSLTPEAVKELRRATDLAFRATKHTARAVGRLMVGSVAAERHLWLNLRGEPFHRYGARSDHKAFLPASNVLSSLKTITATPRGLACRTSSS